MPARRPPPATVRPRTGRRQRRADTRERILKAALAEFAARGYDATSVDRLARRAHVNKALIYYYFRSKLALYRTLVGEQVRRLIDRLHVIREADERADDKLDRYVAALIEYLDDRRELPPLMLRELADGGRRLDGSTLRLLLGFLPILRDIIAQGRTEGVFGTADPLLTHFVLMGSTIFFTGNAPIRRRVLQLGLAQPPMEIEPFVRHLQAVARGTLRRDQTDAAHRP